MKSLSAFCRVAGSVSARRNISPVRDANELLYNLEETVAKIRAATSHLRGLKIGIMGCVVNGPGEMADADYGYVGAGRGKVSLYRKKVCVEKNIPQEEVVEKLLRLIRKDTSL